MANEKKAAPAAALPKSIIINHVPNPLDFELDGVHIRIPDGRSEGVVTPALRKALAPFGEKVEILAAA